MEIFPILLRDILTDLKRKQGTRLTDVAKKAGLSGPYLSNLKNPDRHHKLSEEALEGLIKALEEFHVGSSDLKRLFESANPANRWEQRSLSESWRGRSLIEALVYLQNWDGETTTRTMERKDAQTAVSMFGTRSDFKNIAITLLYKAQKLGKGQRKIYTTWFHGSARNHDDRSEPSVTKALQQLLLATNGTQQWDVYQIWSGHVEKAFFAIRDSLLFLSQTKHYELYEVASGAALPELFIVEDVGAVVGYPQADNDHLYAFFTYHYHDSGKEDHTASEQIKALMEYLNFMLGPKQYRRPVFESGFSSAYDIDVLEKVALYESVATDIGSERFLLQSELTEVCVEPDLWVEIVKLEQASVTPQELESHKLVQQRRYDSWHKRLENGDLEKCVHSKAGLQKQLREMILRLGTDEDSLERYRAQAIQKALYDTLNGLNKERLHMGLVEKELGLTVLIAGNHLGIHYKGKDGSSAVAWTSHTSIIKRIHKEKDDFWQQIPDVWRSDTQNGKLNVTRWLAREAIKAIFSKVKDLSSHIYLSLIRDIATYATQSREMFYRTLTERDRRAAHVVIVNSDFPTTTIPKDTEIDLDESLYFRYGLLNEMIQYTHTYDLIMTKGGINDYWESGKNSSTSVPFTRTRVNAHFRNMQQLLKQNVNSIDVTVLPDESFLFNYEVVDKEFIFIQPRNGSDDVGGICLQDTELASYFVDLANNIKRHCPKIYKGAENVAVWLENEYQY